MTFVQPGVKIDGNTGRAEERHLRFVEMARLGTCLNAKCRLHVADDAQRAAVSALLLAGAKLVERLGGKRRRGAGECGLDVLVNGVPVPLAPALDWIGKTIPVAPTNRQATLAFAAPRSVSGDWVKIPLRIELPHAGRDLRSDGGQRSRVARFHSGNVPAAAHHTGVDQTGHRPSPRDRGGQSACVAGDHRNRRRRRTSRSTRLSSAEGKGGVRRQRAANEEKSVSTINRLVKERGENDPQEKPCRKGYLAH